MTLDELYSIFKEKNLDISTDTRTLKGGDIFFALKGDNFDGGKFVKEALDKGASFVVSENSDVPMDRGVLVQDVLVALQNLAKMHRRNLKIPIIAITGSNGKTTTKELTRVVLSKRYKTLASPSSFNNHVGVPMTILSIRPEHEMAVVEMGDNHVGEIAMLTEIAQPNFGLITNIGKDHIGEFGGFENCVKAKLELFDYFRIDGGTAFVNPHDALLQENISGLEVIPYEDAEHLDSNEFLKVKIGGEEIQTKFVGDYNLENIRAAFTIGKHFGVPADQMAEAIASYEPTNNRSQKVVTEKNEIILDAYNANPESMRLALENFSKIKTGPSTTLRASKKKVVILGDMFDMGEYAPEEHQKVLDMVEGFGFEAYFAGEEFFKLKKNEAILKTTDELIEYLRENKIENSLILIKGSRGMKMESVMKENLI